MKMRIYITMSIVVFVLSCSQINITLERDAEGNLVPQNTAQEKNKFDGFLKKYDANEPQKNNEEMAKRFATPDYRDKLSFAGEGSKFFSEVVNELQLNAQQRKRLNNKGMVISTKRRATFVEIYYDIYQKHLPVFITSDSILYALQRSYVTMLKNLERNLFTPAIVSTLKESQALLKEQAANVSSSSLQNYKDVDLYLTVAQNLFLEGKPTNLRVYPVVASEEKVREILSRIDGLGMETPHTGRVTSIYGGKRFVDYSQFRVRGHYREEGLQGYFRGMMWLGRADCGMILSQANGVNVDPERELRNMVLISQLFTQSPSWKDFKLVDTLLSYLVGDSDNIKIETVVSLLKDHGIKGLGDTRAEHWIAFREDVAKLSQQRINSQALVSDPKSAQREQHPQLFQIFGQRFVIDSFILSNVVYDKIVFQGKKQQRRIPKGLDVMAALGNSEAVSLLQPEMKTWNYTANMLALNELVEGFDDDYWQKSFYNNMLDNLRILDKDVSKDQRYPQVMQTQDWQRKQLVSQLGTWTEMRHNNVLYVKQSYGSISCEYPQGYVEPYPEFYRNLKVYCKSLHSSLSLAKNLVDEQYSYMMNAQIKYFDHFAQTMETLEKIAKKQLSSQPLDENEQSFLKKVVEKAFLGCGGPKTYDGWYCKLYYGGSYDWEPSVTDVHTDPDSQQIVHVATGDAQYCAIVIDNENDLCTYAGPVYSYYEFTAEKRWQDEEWQEQLSSKDVDSSQYLPDWLK
ncbi:DUF3160 domain-containing protein [Candidatus Uabimicrobium amorphum]|uniref:DUF3160 domain-containing protein n=1 Tax=Uabimicrobium amorphum TaxID=2596890 RepID=A0A5S9IU86_UABAM|nr:DUF3160 domain-containing protein [Candidatus Uabimicrobium amorphum]BBM88219.1 hypothetical protein UABAM_06640 [Candidatus Uabimicrobium amorphum]